MDVFKPTSAEISINSTANNVSSASLVRIINTGVAAVLNFQYANGTGYANMTITNTTPYTLVQKRTDDLLVGNGMLAVAVSSASHTLR